ncbi:hypothetical protein ACS0PU_010355 [Formica fusca]
MVFFLVLHPHLPTYAPTHYVPHLWTDFLEIANKNRTSDYLENSHENSAPNNSNGVMVSRDLFHCNIDDTKGRKLKIGVNKEFFAALIPSNI